jgi:N-acetylmuramoyl-L-alanine amidase
MPERYHSLLLFVLALCLTGGLAYVKHETTIQHTAGVWFQESITADDLVQHYDALARAETRRKQPPRTVEEPIRILIVPGHDERSRGALFEGVWEDTMNVAVATQLHALFTADEYVSSTLLRAENGYHEDFRTYLQQYSNDIQKEVTAKKEEMRALIAQGLVESYQTIHHNTALPEVAHTLYAINLYANEQEYDIVLHLHFNDYPGSAGEYKHSGFSVYVPERQYSNAAASKTLGERIAAQLSTQFPTSNYPPESSGIVESQSLIAVGAYNTLDAAVALIEYGYIYENQFQLSGVRDVVFTELAQHTYHGVKNFLSEDDPTPLRMFDPAARLTQPLEKGDESLAVFALQRVLHERGYYPPHNEDIYTCPISGYFGSCTERAVRALQTTHDLPATGYFGEMTLEKLRAQ